MNDEQIDQYLIHSDVFSSDEDRTEDEQLLTNLVSFMVHTNSGQNSNITTDDDGDLDVCRPERIDLILGIKLFLRLEKKKVIASFA